MTNKKFTTSGCIINHFSGFTAYSGEKSGQYGCYPECLLSNAKDRVSISATNRDWNKNLILCCTAASVNEHPCTTPRQINHSSPEGGGEETASHEESSFVDKKSFVDKNSSSCTGSGKKSGTGKNSNSGKKNQKLNKFQKELFTRIFLVRLATINTLTIWGSLSRNSKKSSY